MISIYDVKEMALKVQIQMRKENFLFAKSYATFIFVCSFSYMILRIIIDFFTLIQTSQNIIKLIELFMICRINEDQRQSFLIITLKNTIRSVPLTLDDLESFSQTFTF